MNIIIIPSRLIAPVCSKPSASNRRVGTTDITVEFHLEIVYDIVLKIISKSRWQLICKFNSNKTKTIFFKNLQNSNEIMKKKK